MKTKIVLVSAMIGVALSSIPAISFGKLAAGAPEPVAMNKSVARPHVFYRTAGPEALAAANPTAATFGALAMANPNTYPYSGPLAIS